MADGSLGRAFLGAGIGVCLVATIMSGALGWLAGILYVNENLFEVPQRSRVAAEDAEPHDGVEAPEPEGDSHRAVYATPLGLALGAVGGLGAGVLWVYLARRRTLAMIRRDGRISQGRTVLSGTLWAIIAGAGATALLHAGLAAGTHHWKSAAGNLWGGLLCFGLPAGLVLGLVCSLIWWQVCPASLRGAPNAPAAEDPAP